MKNKSLYTKVKTLTKDLVKWSKNDFGLVTDEQYDSRYEKCKACKSWDPTGYNNTGECLECNCSTIVKLKLISTECPLKHWLEIKP
jgi:hypothetical protein